MEPLQHQVQLLENRLQRLKENLIVSMILDLPGVSFFSSGPDGRNLPAAEPLPKTRVKVLTFDGENSWELYKSLFEVAAKLNGWSDEAKDGNLKAL